MLCPILLAEQGELHEAIGVDQGREVERQWEQVPLGSGSSAHAVRSCLRSLLGLVQMCFHLKVESCCIYSVLFFRASYYTQFMMAISHNTVFGSSMVTCSVSTAGSSSQPVVALLVEEGMAV